MKIVDLIKKYQNPVLQLCIIVFLVFFSYFFYNLGASQSANSDNNNQAGAESPSAQTADNTDAEVVYTCSMHPEIREDEPGDCPICGMELVKETSSEADQPSEPDGYACAMNCVPPLEEPGECPICGMEMQPVYDDAPAQSEIPPERQFVMTEEAYALANIQTTVVERKPAIRHIRLVGRLTVDPTLQRDISADVRGRIDELYADYVGDTVAKGEAIALFYSPELFKLQQEYLQIYRTSQSSAGASDRLQQSREQALVAARERLRIAGLTEPQIQELENTQEAKVRIALQSPIHGTVIQPPAEEGAYVRAGETIISIANLSRLWAEFKAYQPDLQWLAEGQPISFTSNAFPGQQWNCEIEYIDPLVRSQTRTTDVRVTIQNDNHQLKPGMYLEGNVESSLSNESPPLIIPESAPLITGKRAVVYVVIANQETPSFEGREIVLGPKTNDGYVVLEGLVEGEEVVTHGAFQIDSAMQISAKKSMMSRNWRDAHDPDPSDHDQTPTSSPSRERSSPLDAFTSTKSIGEITEIYIAIQSALAEDDAETALRHWEALKDHWQNPPDYINAAIQSQEIEPQRDYFELLSKDVIHAVRKHGNPLQHALRLVHCPMAFDFDGADWLQTEDEVRNPYFGDSMLTCGTVEEEFAPHD